jgi:hypothetical protein
MTYYPGLMPRFYGKPIDCPTGHKWSGYAEDAPAGTSTNPDDFLRPVEIVNTNLWYNQRVDPGF